MKIKISDIIIKPRQRIDLGDIDEMADSLQRLGQIHNIGINENNELIWGMRRLTAAKKLGWDEIEATKKPNISEEQEQELELEEDIKRKDRTWQEKCLACAKLFRIKARSARALGVDWNVRLMASFTGMSKSSVAYSIQVADELSITPKDTGIWLADNYLAAIGLMRDKNEADAAKELEARRTLTAPTNSSNIQPVSNLVTNEFLSLPQSPVQLLDKTWQLDTTPLSPTPDVNLFITRPLKERIADYNYLYGNTGTKNTPLYYQKRGEDEFIHGFWFVGGGNISSLYGSYQIEYLERVQSLFSDAERVVHLFVGSLPPSDKYVRVGLPQGDTQPDIIADAHEFSSYLPFKADLIYADPPYSVEDSEHYANSMVNRERVLSECSAALAPGGYVVWLDQALPLFKNEELNLVGGIACIRSTGNRFRLISIFRKPLKCQPIISSPQVVSTSSKNNPASSSQPLPLLTGLSEFQ